MYSRDFISVLQIIIVSTTIQNSNGIPNPNLNSDEVDEEAELDETVKAAIEEIITRVLEQTLGPSISSATSHEKAGEQPSSSSITSVDEEVLAIIEESVARNLREMLPAFLKMREKVDPDERPEQTTTKKSFAEALKSRSSKPANSRQEEKPKHTSEVVKDAPKLADEDYTILLTPRVRTGSGTPLDELQRANISLAKFGVKRKVTFASGAILLECETREDKENLEKAIAHLDSIFVKPARNSDSHSVRIQKIPVDVDKEELEESILRNYREPPIRMYFMPYRDNRRDKLKGVLIIVNERLLEKMKQTPLMEIRGIEYEIDTAIYLNRCSNCQLLGHRSKYCKLPSRAFPSPEEDCIDCSYYNEMVRKNIKDVKKRLYRNTKHPTDDEKCSSKLWLISKGSILSIDKETAQVSLQKSEKLRESNPDSLGGGGHGTPTHHWILRFIIGIALFYMVLFSPV